MEPDLAGGAQIDQEYERPYLVQSILNKHNTYTENGHNSDQYAIPVKLTMCDLVIEILDDLYTALARS